MIRYLFFTLLTAIGIFPVSGQAPAGDLFLKNCDVVDVEKKVIHNGTDIVIREGVIEAIGISLSVEEGMDVLDLTGKYVIPGLIDAHVHLANDTYGTREDRVAHMGYMLRHGITSARDAAGDARLLAELKRAVHTGEITGPDINYAAFIAGPDYFEGNDRELEMVVGLDSHYAPWMQCITPGDDLDSAMVAAKACGATGIKVYAGYDTEYLPRIVEAAGRYGLETWAHSTLFPACPSETAKAGVKVISHAYMLEWENVDGELSGNMYWNYERYYSDLGQDNIDASEFFKAMKANDSIFDPTLYLCVVNGMDWACRIVEQAHAAGVRICAGTDYINDLVREYPYLYDEIFLYVDRCGFDTWDAIRSGTIVAADATGMASVKGSFSVGKDADLVIITDNPVADIRNLLKIDTVIKKGIVVQ